jgi:hypothetical protein
MASPKETITLIPGQSQRNHNSDHGPRVFNSASSMGEGGLTMNIWKFFDLIRSFFGFGADSLG